MKAEEEEGRVKGVGHGGESWQIQQITRGVAHLDRFCL